MGKNLDKFVASFFGHETDPRAKAMMELFKISESMRETGGANTERKKLLDAASVLESHGNKPQADAMRKLAETMPDTVQRGVGIDQARKLAAQHLLVLDLDDDAVYKNGLTKVCGSKRWQLFQQPDKEKAEAAKSASAPSTK